MWDLIFYRKQVFAGFALGLNGSEVDGINQIKTDKTKIYRSISTILKVSVFLPHHFTNFLLVFTS